MGRAKNLYIETNFRILIPNRNALYVCAKSIMKENVCNYLKVRTLWHKTSLHQNSICMWRQCQDRFLCFISGKNGKYIFRANMKHKIAMLNNLTLSILQTALKLLFFVKKKHKHRIAFFAISRYQVGMLEMFPRGKQRSVNPIWSLPW